MENVYRILAWSFVLWIRHCLLQPTLVTLRQAAFVGSLCKEDMKTAASLLIEVLKRESGTMG